jgi:hypothetical protein
MDSLLKRVSYLRVNLNLGGNIGGGADRSRMPLMQ